MHTVERQLRDDDPEAQQIDEHDQEQNGHSRIDSADGRRLTGWAPGICHAQVGTGRGAPHPSFVMAGLVPAIHVLLKEWKNTWMRGTATMSTLDRLPIASVACVLRHTRCASALRKRRFGEWH